MSLLLLVYLVAFLVSFEVLLPQVLLVVNQVYLIVVLQVYLVAILQVYKLHAFVFVQAVLDSIIGLAFSVVCLLFLRFPQSLILLALFTFPVILTPITEVILFLFSPLLAQFIKVRHQLPLILL